MWQTQPWFSTPASVRQDATTTLIVAENGVYSPARIEVPAGKPVTLRFLRKDPSPCAAQVVFTDFDRTVDLDVNKPVSIQLPALKPGEYAFSCQMQMYRGTLVAR